MHKLCLNIYKFEQTLTETRHAENIILNHPDFCEFKTHNFVVLKQI